MLVAVCSPGKFEAQTSTGNAAVKYLRADAALRQSYPLPPDAANKLVRALNSPLDGEDERLVKAASDALVEFQHGTAVKKCDWALSSEDGPFANTSHRGAITELVAVSGIRARLRFRDQDSKGGINDVLAAMVAARHLSDDGTLASVLFAYNLEDTITEIVALNLGRLSRAELNELAVRFRAMPSGSSMQDALHQEKIVRSELLLFTHRIETRVELVNRLLYEVPYIESNKTLAAEIVDGCGGSVHGFENCVKRQQVFYRSWYRRFKFSPEQFETKYNAEVEQLSKTNPVIRLLTPDLPRLRWAEAYSQTRRALLEALIAVRLDGTKALARHLDPYDQNPFSYISVDGGFRLESRLKENGIPLSLSVFPSPEN
jgi:hypothetical protein